MFEVKDKQNKPLNVHKQKWWLLNKEGYIVLRYQDRLYVPKVDELPREDHGRGS